MQFTLSKRARAFFASKGQKGGEAGTGDAKKRGDHAYYQRISKLGAAARAAKARRGKASADFTGL
jgi:hypothetical protein